MGLVAFWQEVAMRIVPPSPQLPCQVSCGDGSSLGGIHFFGFERFSKDCYEEQELSDLLIAKKKVTKVRAFITIIFWSTGVE